MSHNDRMICGLITVAILLALVVFSAAYGSSKISSQVLIPTFVVGLLMMTLCVLGAVYFCYQREVNLEHLPSRLREDIGLV